MSDAAVLERLKLPKATSDLVINCDVEKIMYGDFLAVRDSTVPIEKGKITGFIGPSGCGKSTVLRCLNRMNDLIKGFRLEGHVTFLGQDIYAKGVDPVVVRRYIGMVFQQPNPFSMSIFDNVAFGLRLNRFKGDIEEKVEHALRRAALWDEVKDKQKASGLSMSAAEAEKIERGVVQVPSTAGMIVLAYNLPGVEGRLKLPQDVYVDIFLGKIRTWDDPRILAANTDLNLPSTNIAVIGRQDSSGTTYAFTSHLTAVSKSWSEGGPGVGKVVSWPRVAMLAHGNEGVASRIKISHGAIGYVEYGFARRLGLSIASLENKDGQFVTPTPEAGAAALAASAGIGLDALAKSMINPPGPQAYPIITYSWLLLYRKYPAEQARALTSFVDFALYKGQSYALDLGYLALPPPVVELGKTALSKIK